MKGDSEHLYKIVYCGRGESENRIKEVQMQLFSCRASCQQILHNQFRMLLSQMAVVIMEYARSTLLRATKFAKSNFSIIRCKLLKIASVIVLTREDISLGCPLIVLIKKRSVRYLGIVHLLEQQQPPSNLNKVVRLQLL